MTCCRNYSILLFTIIFAVTLFGCNNNTKSILATTKPSSETTVEIPETTYNKVLPANTQVFTLDGITLTLPDDFEEVPDQQWPLFYNGYIFAMVVREPFSAHPSLKGMSLDEYCTALIESKGLEATVRFQGGLHWFDYGVDIPDTEQRLYHFVVVYKDSTDFWIVEFSCDSRAAVRYRPFFAQWAKMIEFTD